MTPKTQLVVIAVAAVLAFTVGVVHSRPDYIAPNAVLHVPSDTGEYTLVLEAELVIVSDTGRRLARYHKEDVIPSLKSLLRGEDLQFDNIHGSPHYFDGREVQRQVQTQLRKALFGM
ncbi:MAG: hypothetical protein OXT71_02455 [Acidobacteriota bacterium]|nr:hypothetical protein [Acidobacteriota bacterium]